MYKNILLILCFFSNITAFAQKRQTISYEGKLYTFAASSKNKDIGLMVSIIRGNASGNVVYTEEQKAIADTLGRYHLEIGSGKNSVGQFDSILWSEGIYYLKIAVDTNGGNQYNNNSHTALLRMPDELSNDNEQGTVTSTEHKDYGEWTFRNNRNKRPSLVTIDLTTSYANVAYPADTYPVYRHYEWSDPDRDGKGNSFMISYSDHTNNNFIENSDKLGEIKLYALPFQELLISSSDSEITISITKPVPVKNLSETYSIKGPWKFIYYIEW